MYTYKDFKDKTKKGVVKEIEYGLGIIAAHFQMTLGFPKDYFNDKLKTMTNPEIMLFYMNYRNKHPKLFK